MMSKRDPPRTVTPEKRTPESSVTLPVVQEELTVQTRQSKGATIRVSKSVVEEQVAAEGQCVKRTVSIERIPIDRFVERPTGLRQEGDTLIIPVFEEVPVVVMKTKLKEEIRVTTRTVAERRAMPVTVRREQVSVERIAGETTTSSQRKGTTMKNTIVGLFEDRTEAQRAQSEIVSLNIPIGDTKVFDQPASQEPGATSASDQSWWDSFKEALGFGEFDEGSYYEEGIRRGGVLVSVRAEDDLIDRVADIMEAHGALDIDERVEQWRSSGWTPQPITTGAAGGASVSGSIPSAAGSSAPLADTTAATGSSQSAPEAASMPVIEEELRVGKREVRRGGVRIYRRVTEQPVEETVRLREETVCVERQPVNRPVTTETGSFTEETIEMTEIGEEPVVSKQARVVEEVTVHKEVGERQETIRDTVRRADVEVESTSGAPATAHSEWDDQEARVHWSNHYGSGGIAYEQYDPAYRFGAQLAGGANMDSSDWTQLEPEARRSWEAEHEGTWEQFKEAVRYSWERAKQKLSPSSERRAA